MLRLKDLDVEATKSEFRKLAGIFETFSGESPASWGSRQVWFCSSCRDLRFDIKYVKNGEEMRKL